MFLTATKVAIVESLRSVWFSENQDTNKNTKTLNKNDEPYPKRITIDYPEEAHDWPFILVQIRPTLIEWTGVMPDEIVEFGPDDAKVIKSIRQGKFEATCMLEIMATESQTRDRIWDNLINILLMGRKKNPLNNFYTTLEQNDLVGITIMEGAVRNIGDTITAGTPWSDELLTYEAAIEFDMVGIFYADEYNQDLVPLKKAIIYNYIDYEGIPTEGPNVAEVPGIGGPLPHNPPEAADDPVNPWQPWFLPAGESE